MPLVGDGEGRGASGRMLCSARTCGVVEMGVGYSRFHLPGLHEFAYHAPTDDDSLQQVPKFAHRWVSCATHAHFGTPRGAVMYLQQPFGVGCKRAPRRYEILLLLHPWLNELRA